MLLGLSTNKIIKCHQKIDKPLPSTKIILEPIQKVLFGAVEEVNQLKMCVCVCVCVCLCVCVCEERGLGLLCVCSLCKEQQETNKKNALLFKMKISCSPKKEVPFSTKWDAAQKLKIIVCQLVFILDTKRGNEP